MKTNFHNRIPSLLLFPTYECYLLKIQISFTRRLHLPRKIVQATVSEYFASHVTEASLFLVPFVPKTSSFT